MYRDHTSCRPSAVLQRYQFYKHNQLLQNHRSTLIHCQSSPYSDSMAKSKLRIQMSNPKHLRSMASSSETSSSSTLKASSSRSMTSSCGTTSSSTLKASSSRSVASSSGTHLSISLKGSYSYDRSENNVSQLMLMHISYCYKDMIGFHFTQLSSILSLGIK